MDKIIYIDEKNVQEVYTKTNWLSEHVEKMIKDPMRYGDLRLVLSSDWRIGWILTWTNFNKNYI